MHSEFRDVKCVNDCSLDSKSSQKHNMQIFRGTRPSLSQTGAGSLCTVVILLNVDILRISPLLQSKIAAAAAPVAAAAAAADDGSAPLGPGAPVQC